MKLRTVVISRGKSAMSKITICQQELLCILQQQRECLDNKHILRHLCEQSSGMFVPVGNPSKEPDLGRGTGLPLSWKHRSPGVSEFGSQWLCIHGCF